MDVQRQYVARRDLLKYSGLGLIGVGVAGSVPWVLTGRAAGQTGQVPLDPLTIPKFAHELTIPRVFAPTVVRDRSGQVIRHDYTVSTNAIRAQMLPPGFPRTTLWAFGGQVNIPGSTRPSSWPRHPGRSSRTPGAFRPG